MSNIITLKVRTWDIDFLSSYNYVHIITCIFSGNSYPKCSDSQWTFLQTNISIIVPMEILQANDTLYTIHPVPLMPRWVNKWKFTLWYNNLIRKSFLWNKNNEWVWPGAGEQFFLRGSRIIGKNRFWQFSKNLLHKSWILGPPQAPAPVYTKRSNEAYTTTKKSDKYIS